MSNCTYIGLFGNTDLNLIKFSLKYRNLVALFDALRKHKETIMVKGVVFGTEKAQTIVIDT